MLTIRRSDERGKADLGWLLSRHTFSFGDYYDPDHEGFGPLRVINEDRVRPSEGFGTHAHRDMEIISYVLEGALEHKDSIGTGSVIRPGDVQVMSAGTGIRHSEFNHSKTEPVHFLQIWIVPDRTGIAPRYDQKRFPDDEKRGRLRLVGSPDGRDGSIVIHQDVELFAAILNEGEQATHSFEKRRNGWLQVVRGSVEANGRRLNAGDGAAVQDEAALNMTARADGSEILVFDLP
ncbi:MAG TPA: pirin family protein [Casimicrobiaceae bacterium]|nr:pirin family protein [Casimicrobiaceae bacterium]